MPWYRLENNKIVEIFQTQPVFHPDLMANIISTPSVGVVGQLWTGSNFATPNEPSKLVGGPREPTLAELQANVPTALAYLEAQLDLWINETAKTNSLVKFKNIDSISKYLNSTGDFGVVARALSAWTETVYLEAINLREQVLSGAIPLITWPELKNSLTHFE